MKNILLLLFLFVMSSAQIADAQTKSNAAKPTSLPDISVIGNVVGQSNDTKKDLSLKELEIAFQHYLYPSVKANVFLAFHK